MSYPHPGPRRPRRAPHALRTDDRVVAVFLSGSLATNFDDQESDLDVTVVVDHAGFASFSQQLEQWFHSVGHPVVVAAGPVPDLLTA